MADAHKPTTVKPKYPPLNPGYVIGRAGSDSTDPTYVACRGIFYPSPGFKGPNRTLRQETTLLSSFDNATRQCRLMHNHAPGENLPVPPEGDVVWQHESLSKEEEADEDELESEEEMPLAQSLRLGQHGSSHASRTTKSARGRTRGEQTDGSKEEKNSGVAPPPQQQQDAEGDNAGGDGGWQQTAPPRAWYYLAPGTSTATQKPRAGCEPSRLGLRQSQNSDEVAQLKSNNGVALWFTMPNGDVYRDPLRAEAAVSEAGFRNLKVTRGLGDAGMVYLRDRTKREQEKQERSRSRREKTASARRPSHIPAFFYQFSSEGRNQIRPLPFRQTPQGESRGIKLWGVAPHHPMQANDLITQFRQESASESRGIIKAETLGQTIRDRYAPFSAKKNMTSQSPLPPASRLGSFGQTGREGAWTKIFVSARKKNMTSQFGHYASIPIRKISPNRSGTVQDK
ncbi:hypothetical protein B0H17DRAFT_1140090 [Mycena rosella]|uniref:Uncharacterized protein n=1 Tax=Mycena rosella TaxID=1033263 RepID=A0AAD7G839_MYCRO|nr:hypothetical protein B0H17DRAFT_1140090 [Mycena rosella]